jgi:hypothetical protein
MVVTIVALLGLVVLLIGALVAVLSMQNDKRHEQQRQQDALKEQYRLLQEQLQSVQSQWEERFRKARERFGKVMDLDDEADRVRTEIEQLLANHRLTAAAYKKLAGEYELAVAQYNKLRHEITLLEENLEDISYGLYKPHFNFDTSEEFRRELATTRDTKKQMAKSGAATRFLVEWSVGGSREQGLKMQKQLAKLMLRAFNGETDAAIGNCTWNNVTRMEERIQRAFTAINQLGTVVQVSIVPEYLELAMNELRLQFEYQEKRRAEAEEQRLIREQMREEERVQREAERAEAEAAAEEARYERALQKAREEIKTATGAQLAELSERIGELEGELAAAHAQHERAIAMAQLTRCGYVYVISNIGSFGENMFKLGMTRRLEPLERIRELGDASVPFAFDVHAMVYSDDAPALECALHQHFRERSVNLVNPRKESFHVSIEEIEEFLMECGLGIQLTKLAEAREYRETLALRANGNAHQPRDAFPATLPAGETALLS